MSETYTSDISFLNPTKFVSDKEINKPLREIQGNVDYVLNLINGNKALLSGVFGNLLDYDKNGKKILSNGGSFDTIRKCHSWTALDNLMVSNEKDISFGINNTLIYEGISPNIQEREKWIERDIWIPETLRGQKLIFGIKGSSSDSKSTTTWTSAGGAYEETIGINILGGKEEIQSFVTLGPWLNHGGYANVSYTPEMISQYVSFETTPETKFVKIKIYRTLNSGYLHIDKMFVGGLTIPYDNNIEVYDINYIDINEFYDFENNVTKVLSTGVIGHKVPTAYSNLRLPDLVIWDHLRDWLGTTVSSGGCSMQSVTGRTSCNTSNDKYTISAQGLEGQDTNISVTLYIPPGTTNYKIVATGRQGLAYEDPPGTWNFDEISIDTIDSCVEPNEIIEALLKPQNCYYGLVPALSSVNSTYSTSIPYSYNYFEIKSFVNPPHIIGISDIVYDSNTVILGNLVVTPGSFTVLLSKPPNESGYEIHWSLGSTIICDVSGSNGTSDAISPKQLIDSLNALGATYPQPSTPTVYSNLFDYDTNI